MSFTNGGYLELLESILVLQVQISQTDQGCRVKPHITAKGLQENQAGTKNNAPLNTTFFKEKMKNKILMIEGLFAGYRKGVILAKGSLSIQFDWRIVLCMSQFMLYFTFRN